MREAEKVTVRREAEVGPSVEAEGLQPRQGDRRRSGTPLEGVKNLQPRRGDGVSGSRPGNRVSSCTSRGFAAPPWLPAPRRGCKRGSDSADLQSRPTSRRELANAPTDSRYHSTVRRSPSSNVTAGSYPRSCRVRRMSARENRTSPARAGPNVGGQVGPEHPVQRRDQVQHGRRCGRCRRCTRCPTRSGASAAFTQRLHGVADVGEVARLQAVAVDRRRLAPRPSPR